jgi:hypothetical protein
MKKWLIFTIYCMSIIWPETTLFGQAKVFSIQIDTLIQMGEGKVKRHIQTLKIEKKQAIISELTPAGVFPIRWKSGLVLRYQDFKPGDTLIFKAQATSEKALKAFQVVDEQGNQIGRSASETEFYLQYIVPKIQTLELRIHKRLNLKKQSATVQITRIRPEPPDSFYLVIDTLFSIKKTYTRDTLLTIIRDDTLQIAPIWNIEQSPFAIAHCNIPIQLKPNINLSHVAYWIGIGRDCIQDYQALETTVPAEWSKPGAPVALGALAMGRFLTLPGSPIKDIQYAFTPASDKAGLKNGKNPKTELFTTCKPYNFCILPYSGDNSVSLGSSRFMSMAAFDFNIQFYNKSTVNTYPIAIKMVACYIKVEAGPEEKTVLETKTYQKTLRL